MHSVRVIAVIALLLVAVSQATLRITGTDSCESAPTARLSLDEGISRDMVLLGFSPSAKTLYFSVFVADLSSDMPLTSVSVSVEGYTAHDISVSAQASCPEAGFSPAYLASSKTLSSGDSLALPLWKSGSFIFQIVLPSIKDGSHEVSLVFSEVHSGLEYGNNCTVPNDFVEGRVLPDTLIGKITGDTGLAERQQNVCLSGIVQQFQWYAFRMPEGLSEGVRMNAYVQHPVSSFEPALELYAVSDCSEDSCMNSTVSFERITPRHVAWNAKSGDEYLIRVTADKDVNAMASGKFTLIVGPEDGSYSSLFSSSIEPHPSSVSSSTQAPSSSSSHVPSSSTPVSASSSRRPSSGSLTVSSSVQPSGKTFVVVLAVSSLCILGLGCLVAFWLYSRSKHRQESAAAALEMTSAFGDVLDGINDDDDEDEDGEFKFDTNLNSSVPSAVPTKEEEKASLIPALEMPKTSEDMFTINGDDADEAS